jgi:hypothetical protein
MAKLVAFVGMQDKLQASWSLATEFIYNRWQIKMCTTIEDAHRFKPAALIVWGYADTYVQNFLRTMPNTPTIWVLLSNKDRAPNGIYTIEIPIQPQRLYRAVMDVIKEKESS